MKIAVVFALLHLATAFDPDAGIIITNIIVCLDKNWTC